jgi:hypothetical protein
MLQLNEQSEMYKVYCNMDELDDQECQGAGWTLVMKTNGNKVNLMFFLNLVNLHFLG